MALKEVKKYYYNMLSQYVSLKEDLKDFEQGLKDGYITEDRLNEIKEELNQVKENYDRVAYIMYLFEIPARKSKQPAYKASTKKIENYFKDTNSDQTSIDEENKSIISDIKERLKELTENKAG